jgi:hypothetical protein
MTFTVLAFPIDGRSPAPLLKLFQQGARSPCSVSNSESIAFAQFESNRWLRKTR